MLMSSNGNHALPISDDTVKSVRPERSEGSDSHAPRFSSGCRAAESERVEQYGAEKRARKGIPLLIANHAQSAFGADENQVTLIDERGAEGATRLPRMGKLALARALVADVATRYASANPSSIHGIHPLPHRGDVVTNEMINRMRDEEGI